MSFMYLAYIGLLVQIIFIYVEQLVDNSAATPESHACNSRERNGYTGKRLNGIRHDRGINVCPRYCRPCEVDRTTANHCVQCEQSKGLETYVFQHAEPRYPHNHRNRGYRDNERCARRSTVVASNRHTAG